MFMPDYTSFQFDASDFAFIQDKVLSGNTFQVSGDINAINDTIEFIVPNGKTAFLIEAKIVISTHTNPPQIIDTNSVVTANDRVKADLKIDTVTKDTTNIGVVMSATTNADGGASASGSSGQGQIGDGRFNVSTLSLVGDGIKKIEIENVLDDGSAFATMSGYLV